MWMIHDMFSLPLPLLEKVLRPTIVYIFLILALRVAGKRNMAQLSTTDFIVLLAVANAVQNAIIGNDSSITGGLIGAITLFVLNGAIALLVFRSARARQLIEGTESVLVDQGEIQRENLVRERISMEQLQVAVQRQGANLAEVERAVLEPGGAILVQRLKRTEQQKTLDELNRKVDELLARPPAG